MKKNEKIEEMKKEMVLDLDLETKETIDLLSIGLDLGKFKLTQLDIQKIDKDTIRYLVDTFYQIQDLRKSRDNQLRAVSQGKDGEGFEASSFIAAQIKNVESSIKKIIDAYTDKIPVCYWAKKNIGIGPMISAGFYARLDITKATSAGSFWSYCGLNDNRTPWLGTEKSSKIIKRVMDDIPKEASYVLEAVKTKMQKDRKFKKEFMNFFECLFEKAEETSTFVDEYIVEDALKSSKELIDMLGVDQYYSHISYAFCKAYDSNMVLSDEINTISIDERVNRKPSQIFAGAKNQWQFRRDKSSKVKRYIKKEDLEKFIAKPPYNRELKVLCYKTGECIMKQCNKEESLYGSLYKDRKAYETKKNSMLEYADQASNILKEMNIVKKDVRECLESGKLTDGHINMRAKRYAVKMFLSHFYEMWYLSEYGKTPRTPWILATADDELKLHKDYIYPYVKYEEVLKKFGLPIPEKVYPTPDEL